MENNLLQEEVNFLKEVLQKQQEELNSLRQLLSQAAGRPENNVATKPAEPSNAQPARSTSRRSLLKHLVVGAVAATAATSIVGSGIPAAKADTSGSNNVYGFSAVPNDGVTPAYRPTGGSYGLIGKAGVAATATGSTADLFVGVYGEGPQGVIGIGSDLGVYGTGRVGLSGDGGDAGVRGNTSTGAGVDGTSFTGPGVRGTTASRDYGQAGVLGTASASTGSASGVSGQSSSPSGAGVEGRNNASIGVRGLSSGKYGGEFYGGQANLLLDPHKTKDPSNSYHLAGELFVAVDGTLYYCVTTGTPGTWQILARP